MPSNVKLVVLAALFALCAPLLAQPTVTINQGGLQTDPTNGTPVVFVAVFSEAVINFDGTDISFTGSTVGGTLSASVSTVDNITWNIDVSGMTGTGLVVASIQAGVCNASVGGAPNQASTSTDNQVTYDDEAPTVSINLAGGQADPTNNATINFTVTFNENVTGFDATDVNTAGSTVGGTLVVQVTGGPAVYNVQVTGATSNGNVVITFNAGVAQDAVGNTSLAPTIVDNTVAFDNVAPTVTINQGGSQSDPTSTSPIVFDVVFSESVTGFTGADISFTGSTAGGTLNASVTGSGTTYAVSVTGMTTSGTVVASVNASAAQDAAGNNSAASTSTDNSVQWNQPNNVPVLGTPTWPSVTIGGSDPNFTATILTGQNLNITFPSTDADAGDTLTITVTRTAGSLTPAAAGFTGFSGNTFSDPAPGTSPHSVTLAGSAASAGTITLQVQVSDGTATDTYNIAITITTGNVAPVLGAPTWPSVTVGGTDPNFTAAINTGQSLNVTFPATDINGADTLTTTVTVTGGSLTAAAAGFTGFSGATFNDPAPGTSPHSVTLAGSAATAGTITLQIQVSDGSLTDTYQLAITITAPTPSITVTSPNGGEVLNVGAMVNITWTNGGGFSGNVDIDLSTNGGSTFAVNVATNIANTGSFAWTVPNNPGTTCRIRVRANAGGTPSDSSNSNFTIAVVTPASITLLSPNGGETRIINSGALITWTNGGGFSGNVDILLSTDGGTTFPNVVANNIGNIGFFNWTVPNLPTSSARIRVRATGSGSPFDDSNANFTIMAGTLGGAVGHAGGASSAQMVKPNGKADALHFHVANDAQSPAAFTVTSITVAIATNDNASNLAISHLAGARLQNSNGSTIQTVLNSGTGWSVAGTTVTITFGAATPLSVNVPIGGQVEFYVELFFTGVSVTGAPAPTFACSIDNTSGNALNGGGTSNYPGVVAGGSVTLVDSLPGDEFFDDNDDGTCSTAPARGWQWLLALLALAALAAARRLVRARAER